MAVKDQEIWGLLLQLAYWKVRSSNSSAHVRNPDSNLYLLQRVMFFCQNRKAGQCHGGYQIICLYCPCEAYTQPTGGDLVVLLHLAISPVWEYFLKRFRTFVQVPSTLVCLKSHGGRFLIAVADYHCFFELEGRHCQYMSAQGL